MTLYCKLCKEAGEHISDHHISSRSCGFDENGIFTPDNYCCLTLQALAEVAETRGNDTFFEDEWIYTLAPTKCVRSRVGCDMVFAIYIHQYKSRGRYTSARMILDNHAPPPPLELAVAEETLNSL